VSGPWFSLSDGMSIAELFRFRDFGCCMMDCLTGDGSFDGLGSAGRGLSSSCGFVGLRAMDWVGGGFVLFWGG